MSVENIEKEIRNSLYNQSIDYTVEAIASSCIKKGILPEQVIFKSNGTSTRSYKKDVSAIYTTLNEESNTTLYFLESPREGIYDTLPESIFHSFNATKSSNNTVSIKEEIKKHREEEKAARLFFLPFEQEFFRIKRNLFELEDEFDWLSNASSLIDIYKSYYPILEDLPIEKGYLFLRLMPLIHEIRDDFPKVERCLSLLLDMEVQISLSYTKNRISSYTAPDLGFATLGSTTILGEVIEDGEPDLNVVLRRLGTSECLRQREGLQQRDPNVQSELQDYSFFDHKIRLTHRLCDFFVGAQYAVSVSYSLDDNDAAFSLDGSAIMGYSVCL